MWHSKRKCKCASRVNGQHGEPGWTQQDTMHTCLRKGEKRKIYPNDNRDPYKKEIKIPPPHPHKRKNINYFSHSKDPYFLSRPGRSNNDNCVRKTTIFYPPIFHVTLVVRQGEGVDQKILLLQLFYINVKGRVYLYSIQEPQYSFHRFPHLLYPFPPFPTSPVPFPPFFP